jgi:hypothetical protein
MNVATLVRRWTARGSTAAMVLLAAGAGAQAAAATAQASTAQASTARAAAAPGAAAAGPGANPYSPDFGHPYRHGAVPTLGAAARMHTWARQHLAASRQAAAGPAVHSTPVSNNLVFGGGVDGIGVTTGAEKVYLVFFGKQWGKKGTDAKGNVTLSGDPSGEAPYLQQLFKGLGTGGELWSGVMTQYCESVAVGSQTCPATAPHVAYPSAPLAGVWVDESVKSPTTATAHRLGVEAIKAAAHFGNTTAAANRDAQYFVISPTHTHPDHFNTPAGGFCAWHDYNGDSYVHAASPYGDVAFTNMPYVTDTGLSCGKDFVNSGSAGKRDGISIVAGHEYAETITDQNPDGGWLVSASNPSFPGWENADMCAWDPGQPGQPGSADLVLPTGTFAMQPTWANDYNGGAGGCEFTHPVVSTELLANPGFESGVISPWSATPGVLAAGSGGDPAHTGGWLAQLAGQGGTATGTLSQQVSIWPHQGSYTTATFSFWLDVQTNDPADHAYDTLRVQVLNASGTVLKTLHTYSNLDAAGHYVRHSFSLRSFLGRTITLRFTGTQTLAGHNTSFFVDDTQLNAS